MRIIHAKPFTAIEGGIKGNGLRIFPLALLQMIVLHAFAQDGTLDPSLDPGSGANDGVKSMVVQPDGRILIGGYFTRYNGASRNRIARLYADGSLDTSFNPGTGADLQILSIALQPDGKILVGGAFTAYNGAARNHIARLNPDGSLDGSFHVGTGANGWIYEIKLQSDGKMLIGGFITGYNGVNRGAIARLNIDGSLDTSFSPSTVAKDGVWCMAVQSDGKILMGGNYPSYIGTGRNYVLRLNASGSLDSSFNPGAGANNNVVSIALQADGKALIGGTFSGYDGTTRGRIARLHTDGSLDLSFNPGMGANSNVESIVIQPDGKVLIGGTFTSVNGAARNRIARLNADGSLDVTFNPGSGANNDVYDVVAQSDGKVLIGGWFTSYSGIGRSGVARLIAMVTSVNDPQSLGEIRIHPNPVSDALHLRFFNEASVRPWRYDLLDGHGRRIRSGSSVHAHELLSFKGMPGGIYVIRIFRGHRLVCSARIVHH